MTSDEGAYAAGLRLLNSGGILRRGVTARAVVVLDANNKVLHSQLVPEIKQEPNCDAALAALG